jgi:RsiW-degrading membrane proteinase PrsW (M82 family)
MDLTRRLRGIGTLLLAGGVVLLAGGACCTFLYLVLPFVYRDPDLLTTSLTIASLAALGLTLGYGLAYQAHSFLTGHRSGTFFPPPPWRLASLCILALLVGQLMVSLIPGARLTSLAFPPLHVLVAATPALVVLAFVGRRTRAASWRTVIWELSHGALLAPMGALAAELISLLVIIVVFSLIAALMPGGLDRLVELFANLQDPAWVGNPENLTRLLLSPAALSAIVLVFVVLAPLIEELLKGLGVLALGYRLRGPGEAWLWGVACGAGFAISESLFNGSIALEGWGAVMLMRCAASLMHCVASGVMGLGWHQALVSRRPWRLLAAYGASTGLHGLWNAAAVAVAVPSLVLASEPGAPGTQGLAGLTILGALALLVVLTICMSVAMVLLTNRARQAPPAIHPDSQETALDGEAP